MTTHTNLHPDGPQRPVQSGSGVVTGDPRAAYVEFVILDQLHRKLENTRDAEARLKLHDAILALQERAASMIATRPPASTHNDVGKTHK